MPSEILTLVLTLSACILSVGLTFVVPPRFGWACIAVGVLLLGIYLGIVMPAGTPQYYALLALPFGLGAVAWVQRSKGARSRLEFVGWHTGEARHLPDKPNLTTTWATVRNARGREGVIARKVMVRMEFKTPIATMFTVPSAQWFVTNTLRDGLSHQGYTLAPDLDSDEKQAFVLFATGERAKVWIYDQENVIDLLDQDHWDIHLTVSSENVKGFEVKLGFTLGPDGLRQDDPLITKIRNVKPRMRS